MTEALQGALWTLLPTLSHAPMLHVFRRTLASPQDCGPAPLTAELIPKDPGSSPSSRTLRLTPRQSRERANSLPLSSTLELVRLDPRRGDVLLGSEPPCFLNMSEGLRLPGNGVHLETGLRCARRILKHPKYRSESG